MNKEQLEFLLNADKALWGAFAGKNFVKFSKACKDATKDLPIDIWDNVKVSKWKDHQKKLSLTNLNDTSMRFCCLSFERLATLHFGRKLFEVQIPGNE